MDSPHVIFELRARARFAVPLEAVGTAFALAEQAIEAVPLAPPSVRGIINHGGRIVTLIDVARLVNVQSDISRQVLMTRRQRKGHLGLMVRDVVEVAVLSRSVDVTAGHGVRWVAEHRGNLVHVLDLQRLLDSLTVSIGS